jgi:hypothetical protein
MNIGDIRLLYRPVPFINDGYEILHQWYAVNLFCAIGYIIFQYN